MHGPLNPHGYEAGFTIEQHRDELIDRLGAAIKQIAAKEADLTALREKLETMTIDRDRFLDLADKQLAQLTAAEQRAKVAERAFHNLAVLTTTDAGASILVEAARQLDAALSQPRTGSQSGAVSEKWVSVDKRLPEDCQIVLATNDMYPLGVRVCEYENKANGFHTETRFRVLGSSVPLCKVTHWQPLPAPPEAPSEL